jgi:hypothetical protein
MQCLAESLYGLGDLLERVRPVYLGFELAFGIKPLDEV